MRESIYFALDRAAGLVKIGRSVDVRARVRGLASIHRRVLEVIAVLPSGTRSNERKLHERFAHHRHIDKRLGLEWFEFSPEIQSGLKAEAQ